MKLYHKNPRQISAKRYAALEETLRELGDLSGVVHDLNSDQIIGGNQRSRVFDINHCEIVLTDELDEPDDQGTIALGYVVWEGKRYAYRAVRWTDGQCEKANIVANNSGGGWDFDMLASWPTDDLISWGFDTGLLAEWNDNAANLALMLEAEQDEPPADEVTPERARQTLAERFVVPPFSVLDARQGYWQERKRAWLALGIQSELGRGDNILDGGHSDQSINIDFYSKKRHLEAEVGRTLSTDEARNILVERGEIRHVDRSKAARERERE